MDMKAILEAVASCYEAVIDETQWSHAVDRVSYACQARSGAINYFDFETGLAHDPYDLPDLSYTIFTTNLSKESIAAYGMKTQATEGALYNRIVGFLEDESRGDVFLDTDLIAPELSDLPLDQLRQEEPFRTSIADMGFFRRIGVVLNRSEPWRDILTVQYEQQLTHLPEGAIEQLATMAPYISRALNSGRMLTALHRRYAMVLEVLDRLAVATAIVTEEKEIVLKNKAFDRLLDEGDALRTGLDGAIRAVDPDVEARLSHEIRQATDCSLKNSLYKGMTTAIARGIDKDPVSLDLSPVRFSEFGGPIERGYAILFAIAPEWKLATNGNALAKGFGLSKAEAESLTHYLKGSTYETIADIRGVSRETIKSQISSVLNKTNARNRTELARLVVAAHVPLLD